MSTVELEVLAVAPAEGVEEQQTGQPRVAAPVAGAVTGTGSVAVFVHDVGGAQHSPEHVEIATAFGAAGPSEIGGEAQASFSARWCLRYL